jgi:sirohydrochlorin ferrochelatase
MKMNMPKEGVMERPSHCPARAAEGGLALPPRPAAEIGIWSKQMTERIARQQVTFRGPFFVEGLGRDLPAGTYDVETVEEMIEGVSFLAYRVASMSIAIPLRKDAPHSYQRIRIEPSVVQAAQRDGEESNESA